MAEPGRIATRPVQPLDGRLRIRRGRLATRRPLRRRDAPARQPIPPAHGQARPNVLSMEYELVLDGREFPARSTTACYASRRPRASKPTRSSALPGGRPARRPRPRHRRLQAGKRDRRGAARRACLLLRHLPAPAHADPNGRGRDPGRGALPGRDHRPPSRRGRQARGGGQLPGRLADHDDRRRASRAVRPHHRGRRAAVLLGGLARHESHALFRRPAGRQLAHRAHQRHRQRQVRRRLAGAELREPEPGQHALEQAVQPVPRSTPRRSAT